MREIKFRAWNKVKNKMIKMEELLYSTDWETLSWLDDILLGINKELMLMQYVGIQDKNDIDVFLYHLDRGEEY